MNQQMYEEAAEWLVEFRTGDPDAGTRERFDRWLARSPEHVRAYLECAATSEQLAAGPRLAPAEIEALIERARQSSGRNVVPLPPMPSVGEAHARERDAAPQASKRERAFRRIRFVVAAAVVLAAIGASVDYWMSRDVYATAIGEQRSILLADGSTIDLNARSEVRVRVSARRRSVDLIEGEALFRVAKDKTRPFIVSAKGAHVRAVGTEFAINRRERGLLVTVVEGTVAVSGPIGHPALPANAAPAGSEAGEGATQPPEARNEGSPRLPAHAALAAAKDEILLDAGQQLAVSLSARSGAVSHVRLVDVEDAIAWTRRRLVFDSTPLAEVVAEFNRHSSRALVIQGEGLDDFHISGAFSSTDVQPFIRFLRAQPGVEVIEERDRIVIVHR
jgi:transmembrane sensor